MGFTIIGPDHFLGSGHPDLREKLPPFLGLIESRDAGNAWRPVSRLGQSDFHVLEAAGRHVYGSGSNFRTRAPEFMVSADAGRSWRAAEPPAQITSLAIDPTNERHRYNEIAEPFDWNFTRADLTALLERLDPRDETSTIPLAA